MRLIRDPPNMADANEPHVKAGDSDANAATTAAETAAAAADGGGDGAGGADGQPQPIQLDSEPEPLSKDNWDFWWIGRKIKDTSTEEGGKEDEASIINTTDTRNHPNSNYEKAKNPVTPNEDEKHLGGVAIFFGRDVDSIRLGKGLRVVRKDEAEKWDETKQAGFGICVICEGGQLRTDPEFSNAVPSFGTEMRTTNFMIGECSVCIYSMFLEA